MQKQQWNQRQLRLCAIVLFLLHCWQSESLAQSDRLNLPSVPAGMRFEPSSPAQATPHLGRNNSASGVHLAAVAVANTQLTAEDFSNGPAFATVPAETGQFTVPLRARNSSSSDLRVTSQNELVSIFAQDVDLRVVLADLAAESNANIVIGQNVQANVTMTLNNVPMWEALDAILKINGFMWTKQDNIIYVGLPVASVEGQGNSGGTIPGQSLQVFDLHYVSAEEAIAVVRGLLSSSGQAFVHAADVESNRHTRERIVVEDFADRIQAVSMYLASIDTPPRQVLIEANILQVALDDNQRHGVNLLGLARVAGAQVSVQAQGFANPAASPGFMMGLEGNDLNGMIELLESNSNVRTLAAPKVLVVSGQKARIQIGSKFGYFITTATQTATLQSVDFLDIGVVLEVEPTITQDGRVLLNVQPKVSGGRINADTGLPEEDTTEASTTVLLPNGKGMIIGGLIKESDDYKKSWVPWLGEQPFIGKLFSRNTANVEREEVIIALTPHIVPYDLIVDQREHAGYVQATESSSVGDRYINAQSYPAGVESGAVLLDSNHTFMANDNFAAQPEAGWYSQPQAPQSAPSQTTAPQTQAPAQPQWLPSPQLNSGGGYYPPLQSSSVVPNAYLPGAVVPAPLPSPFPARTGR